MNPHRSLFSQYPLFQLASAFSFGICAANYLPTKLGFSLSACAVCSILALIVLLKMGVRMAGCVLLLAFFFARRTIALLERRSVSHIDGELLTLTGVLDGPPEFARDRVYLSVRVEQGPAKRVSLLAPFRKVETEQEYRHLQLRYGARIRVNTILDRTGNYRNPGVSTLSESLDRNDYDATGLVKSPA